MQCESKTMKSMLVTQSFGGQSEYRRAIFMIWSYWAHASAPKKILLFTDNPDYFKVYFSGRDVDYILLTPSRIKEMRGEIDFLHRMKIAMIEEAFSISGADLMYVDSDTFFVEDPTPLTQQVSANIAFMHLCEYRFDSLLKMKLPAGAIFHDFVNCLSEDRFFMEDGRKLPVSITQYSWNAGAMLLHSTHSKFLNEVYLLAEQFYIATKNHACEQYAFSIVLQTNTELRSFEKYVYHYWHRVEKRIVDQFLMSRVSTSWALSPSNKKLDEVRNWSQIMPHYFKWHVFMLRDNAIQAFNDNKFIKGYFYAALSLLRNPFSVKFMRDVLYHTKRVIW